ncbi:MAG TPA: YdbL family protein [Syntrophorhabdales bacterium]|nr:YdbL family protein [Syntrophorhabdales bacterium]
MKRLARIGLFCLIMLAACVTVNIYFPAADVQKAADNIVGDVTGEGQQAPAPAKPDNSSWLLEPLRIASSIRLGPTNAFAQVNVNVSTPAIRALKESMRNEFHQLEPYYEKTVVGENNNGFVEIRDTAGLDLKEQAQVKQYVDQVNKDRTALYKEIQTANKYPAEVLPQIQRIFANSWREKSHSGWWTQNDNGQWIKK